MQGQDQNVSLLPQRQSQNFTVATVKNFYATVIFLLHSFPVRNIILPPEGARAPAVICPNKYIYVNESVFKINDSSNVYKNSIAWAAMTFL